MNLRVWVILAMLLMAGIIDSFLIYTEFVPIPAALQAQVVEEILPLLSYTPGQRKTNLAKMGLSAADISVADRKFGEYEKDKKAFRKMFLHDDTPIRDVAGALCPGGEIPQPYSALAILVSEANKQRTVVDSRTQSLGKQPWFDATTARNLYKEWEQVRVRQDDATVMAVSAMLLGDSESTKALKHEQPWGRGLFTNGAFSDVKREYPNAARLVPEYFALMHFMSELANDESQGICD